MSTILKLEQKYVLLKSNMNNDKIPYLSRFTCPLLKKLKKGPQKRSSKVLES
jgi:hypothetical protein